MRELGLLTGKLSDAEYFAGIPRRGWAHRRRRIRQTIAEILVLATSILMLIFVLWAMAGASLPGDVR